MIAPAIINHRIAEAEPNIPPKENIDKRETNTRPKINIIIMRAPEENPIKAKVSGINIARMNLEISTSKINCPRVIKICETCEKSE